MKAVMYHYIRRPEPRSPYQRFLHVDDFRRQLDWFTDKFGFTDRSAFESAITTAEPADGIILTFDDALADHHDVVLPELLDRGLWGIFYVPTAPYRTGRLLPVHRLHHLIGRFGGPALLERTTALVDDTMLAHEHVAEFHTATYGRVDDDEATDRFKRMLNYFIAEAHRDEVIDALMLAFGVDEAAAAADYYVGAAQLRQMAAAGMVIGSHSDGHRVLSTLDPEQQRADLSTSFDTLRELLGQPVVTYCHPFGGFHSFNAATEELLVEHGMRYAFNVEPRDVAATDLRDRPMALPRFDCNAFPHGRASTGADRPLAPN